MSHDNSGQGPERLAALLCETAPSDGGHSWYLSDRRKGEGPCSNHIGQAARLAGRVSLPDSGDAPPTAAPSLESWHKHECRGSSKDANAHDPCSCVCGAVSNDRGKTWASVRAAPDGLRAALETIATMRPVNSPRTKTVTQDVAQAFYRAQEIARAALGSAPPEPWSTQELYHVAAEVRHRGSLDNAVSYLRDALNRMGSAPRETPEDR